MKKLYFGLLLMAITHISQGQSSDTLDCDVPDRDTTEFQQLPWWDNNNYLEDFLDSIGYPGNNSRVIGSDRVKYHVPIKFWVYRDDAGVGGPTLLHLQTYINTLNQFYNVDNNTYIGFYMKCDIGFIDDDDHLEIRDVEALLLSQSYKEPGAINVHITDNIRSATGVHYRSRIIGVDAIFLEAATYTSPVFLGATLAHEVGHYFELDHTHQYEDWNSKCLTEAIDRNRAWPALNLCISSRLRSRNVSESTGDGLRDTPADHDLSTNNSCNYEVTGEADPWGDQYETPPMGSVSPDPQNIMSYNRQRGCRDVFSRLQIGVMLHSIVRGKSSGNETKWQDLRTEYDEYEPDNNSLNADPIILNEIQERNFHQQIRGE